jgi:crooked neck
LIRVRKRKEYEDALRRQRHNLGIWIRYAEWEGAQRDFRRYLVFFVLFLYVKIASMLSARSVYERALVVDFSNIGLWSKYIEMETKNKFVNSVYLLQYHSLY